MSLLDDLVSIRGACPPDIPMPVWLRAAECVEEAVAAAIDHEIADATGALHFAIARALMAEPLKRKSDIQ